MRLPSALALLQTLVPRPARLFLRAALAGGSVLALPTLAGCAPVLPSTLASDPTFTERAAAIPWFTASTASQQPTIVSVVRRVRAVSCNHRFDLKIGEADALNQLKGWALAVGGNGLVGVKSDLIINTKSPCWHGYEATGVAVVFDRPRTP
jgi:hypothetical protein